MLLFHEVCDTMRYIYVRSKAHEVASLI